MTALHQALKERDIAVVEDEAMAAELTRLSDDFRLRAPLSPPSPAPLASAPVSTGAALPRRVLLVTHNLDLEGAPLFLVDYARHLVSRGVEVSLLSPVDGPLRTRFEESGIRVAWVDAASIFAAPSAEIAQKLICDLAFDFSVFDLVVCNTFTTFWAVHAAKTAGRRVLLYVHESTTPASFYHSRANPEVIALVDRAFELADCVSFTTASTRDYHTDYGRPTCHRLSPGWINVVRLDEWRAQETHGSLLRARFSLKPGELLVTNVGTVSGRKGQHIFARAVDLLWRPVIPPLPRAPGHRCWAFATRPSIRCLANCSDN